MSALPTVNEETKMLLQETLSRFVARDAQIVQVDPLPIGAGLSGAEVRRYAIIYLTGAGEVHTQLVTKRVDNREWRVLQHLNAQQQPNVPFAYTLENPIANPVAGGTAGKPYLLCMQDVGSVYRPTSLEPIADEALEREAEGLAAIHQANFDYQPLLTWLPRMDRPDAVGE